MAFRLGSGRLLHLRRGQTEQCPSRLALPHNPATSDYHPFLTLQAAGASATTQDAFQCNALHHAAARGHVAAVEALLLCPQAADSISAADCSGAQPLHAAAAAGQRQVVQLLLANGASPGARDALGRTPLHAAVAQDWADVAQALVAAGADPNAPDTADGEAPLHVAAAAGHLESCAQLLACGAAVGARCGRGLFAIVCRREV